MDVVLEVMLPSSIDRTDHIVPVSYETILR